MRTKIVSLNDIVLQCETVIFDIDGTLYHLLPLRAGMAISLAADTLLHPGNLPLARALLYFRKIRKKPEYKNAGTDKQIHYSADKFNQPFEKVYDYISQWLYVKPLKIIPVYKDKSVLQFVNELSAAGKRIVFYSDYSAEDKLKVLGLGYDLLFYPGHGIPDELKPSPNAMRSILEKISAAPEKLLYIGDEDSKDGASARLAGISYLNVKELKRIISISGK